MDKLTRENMGEIVNLRRARRQQARVAGRIDRNPRSELVNYRVRGNHMIVDRLFAASELHLGDGGSERRVRIMRTEGRPSWRAIQRATPNQVATAISRRTCACGPSGRR